MANSEVSDMSENGRFSALPAVIAARLLGADVVETEYLARAGFLPYQWRPMKLGGLLVVPRMRS